MSGDLIVGMRVVMSPLGLVEFSGRRSQSGVVVGKGRLSYLVTIRRDGCQARETWHRDFWEPAVAASRDGETER